MKTEKQRPRDLSYYQGTRDAISILNIAYEKAYLTDCSGTLVGAIKHLTSGLVDDLANAEPFDYAAKVVVESMVSRYSSNIDSNRFHKAPNPKVVCGFPKDDSGDCTSDDCYCECREESCVCVVAVDRM